MLEGASFGEVLQSSQCFSEFRDGLLGEGGGGCDEEVGGGDGSREWDGFDGLEDEEVLLFLLGGLLDVVVGG